MTVRPFNYVFLYIVIIYVMKYIVPLEPYPVVFKMNIGIFF